MSSPDEYISPLMAREKPDKSYGAPTKQWQLPSQLPSRPKKIYAVYKIDPSWPKTLVEKLSNSHCRICNVELTSSQHARAHYEGKPHRKRIEKWLFNHGQEAEEATKNDSTYTAENPDYTPKMVRPDARLSKVPQGPELYPYNFTLDCTDLPKMHIHSDGSIEGKPNSKASNEDIAKISSCFIKYILKECLKAKKNKDKEIKKAKKRKSDGEAAAEDENAVGKIEGSYCRIAFYSLTLNKELWLHRNKAAKRTTERPSVSPLQNEVAITQTQMELAEFGRGDAIGGSMTLNFEIHIWQNTAEPYRILVTGKPYGSAGVQNMMWKNMFTFFSGMAKRHLPRAVQWVKQRNSKKPPETSKPAKQVPDHAASVHQSSETTKTVNAPSNSAKQKQVPDNAASMNPVMVLNQMRPSVEFVTNRTTDDNNRPYFKVSANIEGQEFTGEGSNIKKVKAQVAKNAIYRLFDVESTYEIPA